MCLGQTQMGDVVAAAAAADASMPLFCCALHVYVCVISCV